MMLKNIVYKYLALGISSVFGKKFYNKVKLVKDKHSRRLESSFIRQYIQSMPNLIEKIKKKDYIEIIFFVTNISMWRYDGLVDLLIKNPKFKVQIVPFIYQNLPESIARDVNKTIINYCAEKGFPVIDEYNFETRTYSETLYSFTPDIVVYTQPYNRGDRRLGYERYSKNALFLYTPYGLGVDSNPIFFDTCLHNISSILYLQTPIEYEMQKKYARNKGNNAVVVGSTTDEELKSELINPWPQGGRYKIIWAPHHTIGNTDILSNSTFLKVCDYMLEIAKKYTNIDFAFRPHPYLKEKLYRIWGKERTDSYYENWINMPNTFLSTGSFTPLFKYSDAMIHDCASFICEYLLTGHPALYLVNKDGLSELSEMGLECYNYHYHGITKSDIDRFIKEQVIQHNDPLKKERHLFIKNKILMSNGLTVGENMYNSLLKLLN